MTSRKVARLFGRRASDGGDDANPVLQPQKLRAIDHAARRLAPTSVADLGGVWAVEAGYTFAAIDRCDLDRAVLVDTGVTEAVRERAAQHPQMEIVEANFGSAEAAAQVGAVDVVLLFDVLLHQVDPDWDEVIALYAERTSAFVVVQPQWTWTDETIRLVDLGRDEYLASVPDEALARSLFDRIDDTHPGYGRPWRDVHEVWQWGITDEALVDRMRGHGFHMTFFEDDGSWRGLDRFASRSFVFQR